jgi:hypothetical protein
MVSPLRPELYRQLQARFGKVLIANEGEEMVAHVDTDPCAGRLQLRVDWAGEFYRVACCFCGDSRYRLWINHRWGLYVPALKSDNLFLATCYNENCLARPGRAWELRDAVFSGFARGHDPDPVRPGRRLAGPLRPGQYRPAGPDLVPLHDLGSGHPANSFLLQRGFDPVALSRQYGVRYCRQPYPEFATALHRIVIPIVFRGREVGWQGRHVGPPPVRVPKYVSMPGMRINEVLYNHDLARTYPYVVLCEGCADVWRVGPPAVALLGKTLSVYQRQLLALAWGAGAVVVLLDGDAPEEARRAYDALAGRVRQRVLVRLPPGTDPGGLDHGDLWRLIDEAARGQGVDLLALGGPVRGGGQK